jgi:hypothetical protein
MSQPPNSITTEVIREIMPPYQLSAACCRPASPLCPNRRPMPPPPGEKRTSPG